MRRNNELWMLMAVVICSAMIWLMPVNIQAAKKNKVTYKVQKNTLIIQGKGAM